MSGEQKFLIASSILEVSDFADIVVLLTEWPEFKTYKWGEIIQKMKSPIFFDTKNFLDEEAMRSFGFQYYSIGR